MIRLLLLCLTTAFTLSAGDGVTKASAEHEQVTARRLNRYEYSNTVRDLLSVDFRTADDFPPDDSGYGFDNIAGVLSVSPLLMEKYLAAAEKIAKIAIAIDPLPQATLVRHSRSEAMRDSSSTRLKLKHTAAFEADYEFGIRVGGRRDPLISVLSIDGNFIQSVPVEHHPDIQGTAFVKAHLGRGEHVLLVEIAPNGPRIVEPLFDDSGKPIKPQSNPSISGIEVRGPYNPVPPPSPESHKRIFICGHQPGQHADACARIDLAELTRRAYRRPVTDDELDRLVRLVRMAEERGDSFEQGMRVALEAILVSPQFLFRMEHEPEASEAAGTRGIDDFELATRLSYFLWSSMPDEELFRLAAQNRLSDPAVLRDQVQRMLLSPKSRSLVESFGGQWLELRNLDSLKPDPYKFSAFDQDLRLAMKLETQEFFESIIHEDRPILDFINANYTFLNARLAKFYGIPGVEGDEFRRVELRNMPQRGGLLGQASVLTVSSYPTRTSPVLRGKWILENLLNAPPPPPPPDVPNLDDHANATASMREQLEQHRKNPTCAACHARMDPLGFGLENYDAIGRWRTRDGKLPIDASGTLPNGKSFSGPSDLKQILLADKDTFTKCLASKLLTYALGRGLEASDRATVESIASETAAGGYRFSQLILAIVNSPSFQMRRGEVQ